VVFERLFGDGGTSAQRLGQMRRTRSILDSVIEEATHLQQTLGAGDRATVSDYFDSLREVERRIQKAETRGTDSPLPAAERSPIGIPAKLDEHVKLMFDLQWLAYQADLT